MNGKSCVVLNICEEQSDLEECTYTSDIFYLVNLLTRFSKSFALSLKSDPFWAWSQASFSA
jgi:hypothetical protein